MLVTIGKNQTLVEIGLRNQHYNFSGDRPEESTLQLQWRYDLDFQCHMSWSAFFFVFSEER